MLCRLVQRWPFTGCPERILRWRRVCSDIGLARSRLDHRAVTGCVLVYRRPFHQGSSGGAGGVAGIAADRYAGAVMAAIARTAAQMGSVILSPGSAWLSSAAGLSALVGPGSSVPLFHAVVACVAFRDSPVFRPTEIVTIVVRAPSRWADLTTLSCLLLGRKVARALRARLKPSQFAACAKVQCMRGAMAQASSSLSSALLASPAGLRRRTRPILRAVLHRFCRLIGVLRRTCVVRFAVNFSTPAGPLPAA